MNTNKQSSNKNYKMEATLEVISHEYSQILITYNALMLLENQQY